MRGHRRLAFTAAAAAFLWLCAPAGAQQGSQGKKGAKGAEAPAAAPGNAYAQRFAQLCAACHGADGRSDTPNTPVLAGQHSFYAITQLFLFREGRRSNEAMSAVAKGMKDEDMRGFADFIATLPPVPAPPPAAPADAARMARGKALAQEHKCVFCHGADFSGGQQVPRIGGQREDYLKMTLHEFKSAKRVGYTMAMAEAVGRIPGEDLDTLAYYLARFPGPSPSPTK